MKEAAIEVWRLLLRSAHEPRTERHLLRALAAMIADAASADAASTTGDKRRQFAERLGKEIAESVPGTQAPRERIASLQPRLEAAVDAMVGVPLEPDAEAD